MSEFLPQFNWFTLAEKCLIAIVTKQQHEKHMDQSLSIKRTNIMGNSSVIIANDSYQQVEYEALKKG